MNGANISQHHAALHFILHMVYSTVEVAHEVGEGRQVHTDSVTEHDMKLCSRCIRSVALASYFPTSKSPNGSHFRCEQIKTCEQRVKGIVLTVWVDSIHSIIRSSIASSECECAVASLQACYHVDCQTSSVLLMLRFVVCHLVRRSVLSRSGPHGEEHCWKCQSQR